MSDKPYQDPDWLHQKLRVEKKNYAQASQEVNVDSKQVQHWATQHGIKKPIEDPEWYEEKVELGWDTDRIAKELGAKKYEVIIKLNQLGVVQHGV